MKYKGSARKTKTLKGAVLFGLIFTAATFFIFTFVASLILFYMRDPLKSSGIASLVVLLSTGSISGYVTAKYKKENCVITAGACSLTFAFLLFSIGLIMSGGKIAAVTIFNLILYAVLSLAFAAFSGKEKRRRIRR